MACVVVGMLVLSGPVAALNEHPTGTDGSSPVVESGGDEEYDYENAEKYNYTQWNMNPEDGDYHPGAEPFWMNSFQFPVDYAEIWEIGITISAEGVDNGASMGTCSVQNVRAFGIDRGGNNSGTETDEDALEYLKDYEFHDNYFWITFNREEDFGNSLSASDEDIMYGALESCFQNPSEPGWYWFVGHINGITPDDEFVHLEVPNRNWYPVCECSSREEAREELGPPPSENGTDDAPTPTPTPEDGTAETPTPTAADVDTPTPEVGDETNDDDDDPAGEDGDDGQMTPTGGDGPGFGTFAALVALFACAVFAHRRSV